MSTRSTWIAIVMMLHPAVHATETIAKFEKSCVELKRKASLCRCLAANLERKLPSQEIDLELAVRALKVQPPGEEENSTAYDNVADFIAGLEPNCLKSAKFIGD